MRKNRQKKAEDTEQLALSIITGAWGETGRAMTVVRRIPYCASASLQFVRAAKVARTNSHEVDKDPVETSLDDWRYS